MSDVVSVTGQQGCDGLFIPNLTKQLDQQACNIARVNFFWQTKSIPLFFGMMCQC